jgi:DNA repair protein RecO (recombination protein O)
MTLKYRTKGLIFQKKDRSEADVSFSIFTEDFGRLEVTAKAVKKITSKLRGGIDLFYFSEIEFIQGKNSKTLTDTTSIKIPIDLYSDLKKFGTACRIADILEKFIKGEEKDIKTFYLTLQSLDMVTGNGLKFKNQNLLFQYFFWNFISLHGYRLAAEKCAACSGIIRPTDIYFSAKDGGVVCRDCFLKIGKGLKINQDVVKTLRLILNKNVGVLSKLKIGEPSMGIMENLSTNALEAFSPIHN